MSGLIVRTCGEESLDLLAELNKQLIEDEKHDNPMSLAQLKERMRAFLQTDYKAYLFVEQNEVRGYALVNHERRPLYLRQFFICRASRREGYGRAAFEKLLLALDAKEIDLEVLHGNERGYQFWQAMGFEERSVYMRFSQE